eukprot:scaffold7502_cov112-Isochrysis_galbana.AAC.1
MAGATLHRSAGTTSALASAFGPALVCAFTEKTEKPLGKASALSGTGCRLALWMLRPAGGGSLRVDARQVRRRPAAKNRRGASGRCCLVWEKTPRAWATNRRGSPVRRIDAARLGQDLEPHPELKNRRRARDKNRCRGSGPELGGSQEWLRWPASE